MHLSSNATRASTLSLLLCYLVILEQILITLYQLFLNLLYLGLSIEFVLFRVWLLQECRLR